MPPVAFAALYGAVWVAEHIIEISIVSAACGALAVAAVVALMRWGDRRDARQAAGVELWHAREAPALAATVIPQVRRVEERPAIVNHYHINFDPADREAARIIRRAVTNTQLPRDSQDREPG